MKNLSIFIVFKSLQEILLLVSQEICFFQLMVIDGD